MPLHDFIFSKEPGKRWQRHLLFWITWWSYFAFSNWLFQQPVPGFKDQPYFINVGSHLLFKTVALIGVYLVACYVIMYVLLPLLEKRKWLKAGLLFTSVLTFMYITVYFLFWNVFPVIDQLFGSPKQRNWNTRFWPPVNLGLIAPLKIIASAVAIKYIKNWWLKQKENERINREKIDTELALLKAQVHPDFLLNTLNSIHNNAVAASPGTPAMLLQLSDLLSYMLYECDGSTVPLGKEIDMMKEYMQLEKVRHNNEPEIEINIKGDLAGKQIAPFLLLPFIENSFKHCTPMTEQFWINMDIRLEEDQFSMKLTNGAPELTNGQLLPVTNGLENVIKRLNFLYPGKHELKITSEQEMFIVLLNISLSEPQGHFENENVFLNSYQEVAGPVLNYAAE